MRPIKNRIFCIECQRPKILFESKSKALNFIKYNSDEIKEEIVPAPQKKRRQRRNNKYLKA